ncbi:MAG TPA: methyltransferase [Polyangiaceae bacterium]
MKSELDAEHISSLCRGFMESRLLLTGVELDLFTTLSGRWLNVDEIASPNAWDPRATRILLDALCVTGLLDKRSGRYSTTELSAEMLSRTGPYSIFDTAFHSATLWHHWSTLTDRVVGSGTRPPSDPLRAFIGAMELLAPRLAPGLVALIRAEKGCRLLDVGGGGGAYTAAFLARDRTIDATLFDLPEVLPITAEYLKDADCLDRVRLVAGDLTRDELPGGQNLVFLSAIVHMLSLSDNQELFRRTFRALVPGGRIVLRDHVMSADRLQPRAGAIFAANMLVATRNGDTYTLSELKGALEGAGFVDTRLLQDGERMNAIVEAYRPNR